MPTALQLPVRTEATEKVGRRRFRKHVLPIGEIEHEGRKLSFTKDYLTSLVDAFKQGAFDQVPFVLADEKNRHNEDPDRFRGEVKDLELSNRGLHVIVETSRRGAKLLEENPKLGVSARIVEGLKQSDGRFFPRALRHVCATMDPVVTGLQDWEPLSIRSLSQSSDYQVVDLTAATFVPQTKTPTLTDDQLTELQGLKPDERAAKVSEFLGAKPEGKEKSEGDEKKPRFPGLRKLLGIDAGASEEELDAALGKLADGDEEDEVKKVDTPDLATANLSQAAREAIDLANTRAANAESSVTDLSKQLAASEWARERKEYEGEGVPPALLDLAKPVMESATVTIDLSNGEKVDPKTLMRKVLDEAKGTIDLSTVGSAKDKELEDQAKDLASDEKWNASI